jgi:Ca2+-binding RTX toxin-like protein
MVPPIFFRGLPYNYRFGDRDDATLIGDSSNEFFQALGGKNVVITGEGSNVVLAGATYSTRPTATGIAEIITPIDNADNNEVIAGSGNDYVIAGTGDDFINLGEGNNTYDGRLGGSDTVFAGSGNDHILVNAAGTATINVGEGNNLVTATGFEVVVSAGSGDDIIRVTGGRSASVNAGEGNNLIFASGGRQLDVTTGAGDDTIFVQSGNPFINAGEGDNYIQIVNSYGGPVGIAAGYGRDTFNLGALTGFATITQFTQGDRIVLADLAGTRKEQNGQNVDIFQNNSLKVTVNNSQVADVRVEAGTARWRSLPERESLPTVLENPFAAPLITSGGLTT